MANKSTGESVSRKQLIILGGLFVVLLGIVYFMFLRGGGEEAPTVATPAPAPVTAPDPAEDEDEAAVPKNKGKGLIETSDVLGGKDPFEAVLDLTPDTSGEAAATDDTTTDGGTTTPTDAGTTTPTDGGTTTTPPPVVEPPPSDDADEPKTGYSVRLLKIYTKNGERVALVETRNRATGTKRLHDVSTGERFATRFKLTSMDKKCAQFLYGDEPFALCEGQRITRK